MSDTDDRKGVREALAKLIRTNANPNKIQDAFAASRTADVGERGRIVYIGSAGQGDPHLAQDVVLRAYLLTINLITRYPAQQAGWAQQAVDEIIDEMRAEIDRIVEGNWRAQINWQALTFEGHSRVLDVEIAEKQIKYRLEVIPVQVVP